MATVSRLAVRPVPADATRPASTILRVSPSPRGERPLPRLAIGAVLLVLGVGVALAVFDRDDNTFNPDVGFVDTNEDTPSATASRPRADEHPADDGFSWPIYGYSKARTHHLAIKRAPRPPYRQAWAVRGRVLLEFGPVLCGRRVYLLKNNGALYAISRNTGRVSWTRKLGSLAAASPACDGKTIYAVLLKRFSESGGGRVIAVSAKDGRTRWSRRLPSRSESSPLVDRGRVYIGSENGTVYSLRTRDGQVRWRAKAAGAVKGAIALDAGKLYFGDYGGKVHAIRRSNGTKVWEKSPGERRRARHRRRQLLLLRRGRVRARLHRQHERHRLLAVELRRQARLESPHGRLRLRLARRRPGPRRQADGLHRLLRRQLLRARRAHRPAALGALAGLEDLGRGVDHRRPRVRLGSRQHVDVGARRAHRQDGVEDPPRRLQPGDQRRAAHLLHGLHVAVRARPDGAPVRSLGEVTRGGQAGGAGRRPPARGAREGGAPARRAAQAGAGDRAPPAPAALPLRAARSSPQRQARLQAQLPPAPPRLQGARQDDRAAPQPLPLAHPRGAGARVRRARRCRPPRGAPSPRGCGTCRSGRSRPPAPRRRRPAARSRGARACPRRRRR